MLNYTDQDSNRQSATSDNLAIQERLTNQLEDKIAELEAVRLNIQETISASENKPDSLQQPNYSADEISSLVDEAEILYNTGDFEAASNKCLFAIEQEIDAAAIYNLLGASWAKLGQIDLALDAYDLGLKLEPFNAVLLQNSGVALSKAGEYSRAIERFQEAIEQDDSNPVYHHNLANLFLKLGRINDSIAAHHRATQIDPTFSHSWHGLGRLVAIAGETEAAKMSYEKAIACDSGRYDSLHNLASLHATEGSFSKALALLEDALSIKPDFAEALVLRSAITSNKNKTFDHELFAKSIEDNPQLAFAHCSRNNLSNFYDLKRPDQFGYHQSFGAQFKQPFMQRRPNQSVKANGKIRIGYVSGDFRQHSVSYFFEPLLRSHDKNQFEIFCYYNNGVLDETTLRLMGYADHWRSIAGLSDDVVADLVQHDEIHILVDLAGHTAKNNLLTFAKKPAPIQATWLGYPNTTGLEAIDFRLTDEIADPVGDSDQWHTEELVRLPNGAWCFEGDATLQSVTALPHDKNGFITFGSFNNLSKVTVDVIEVWAQVLNQVPNSKLLLKSKQLGEPECVDFLKKLFADQGVTEDKLELLSQTQERDSHLSLYGRVDLALDTFPYNGTTTTCEALWMGTPVLTVMGDRHAARVGASLLHRVDLNEFVAENLNDYVNKAVDLAKNPTTLRDLRPQLRQKMLNSSLCDAQSFTRDIENAYHQMWDQCIR